MKKLFFLGVLAFSFTASSQFAPFQTDKNYQLYLDLNEVKNDRLPVQMVPPLLDRDSVEFHMPRIIPGTYDVNNYGRFVNSFKAQDGSGNELKVKQVAINRWRIYEARNLYKITYEVDDTYDAEESGVFQPAGTSLEDSVFLLNNFGFIGYLDGYKEWPFKLNIEKPAGFYGSTALQGSIGDTVDVFDVANYFEVHDNPIMYCLPDTATKMVGGAEVLVSVYSPQKQVNASESMQRIEAVLEAAAVYLGGNLPVEKYAVLIYCVPLAEAGTSYGALEHHSSTVLYMPEFGGEQFYSGVRDITSHEFFHIITPLRIHSEMISDFNFINPEMSRHIWFYEGVTEYNSHLVQVRNGIYELDDFLEVTRGKMNTAANYNEDIPLTVASEHTLTFFKDQYGDFYQKGHLAGMVLDLKLIELSEGEYRLVDLLNDLGNSYGQDSFFVDEQFFDIISGMTYPELREFFARHYEGAEPFPFKDLLEQVGIDYLEAVEVESLTLGNVDFDYNFDTDRIQVASVAEMDNFGSKLGWQEGDEIVEFMGRELNLGNMTEVFDQFFDSIEEGDKVTIAVARPDGNGGFKKKKLKARAELGYNYEFNMLRPTENPTARQLKLRKSWLNL